MINVMLRDLQQKSKFIYEATRCVITVDLIKESNAEDAWVTEVRCVECQTYLTLKRIVIDKENTNFLFTNVTKEINSKS